jgi:hypothetical protein
MEPVMADSALTGEVSNSKVAAVFVDADTAREVAGRVRRALQLSDEQVQVITPFDRRPGLKLEPEDRGILRTLVRAHVKLGVLGLIAGLFVFGVMWARAVPWIVNSAWLSAGVLASFGALAGLLLGGLMTLRPDHDPYILKVREALGAGRSAVVVHAFTHQQKVDAQALLHQASGEVVATL